MSAVADLFGTLSPTAAQCSPSVASGRSAFAVLTEINYPLRPLSPLQCAGMWSWLLISTRTASLKRPSTCPFASALHINSPLLKHSPVPLWPPSPEAAGSPLITASLRRWRLFFSIRDAARDKLLRKRERRCEGHRPFPHNFSLIGRRNQRRVDFYGFQPVGCGSPGSLIRRPPQSWLLRIRSLILAVNLLSPNVFFFCVCVCATSSPLSSVTAAVAVGLTEAQPSERGWTL